MNLGGYVTLVLVARSSACIADVIPTIHWVIVVCAEGLLETIDVDQPVYKVSEACATLWIKSSQDMPEGSLAMV